MLLLFSFLLFEAQANLILNLETIYSDYKPFKGRILSGLADGDSVKFERNLQSTHGNFASLSNIFNIHYNVRMLIGTPAKEYRLILDTGSNWLWVGSTTCENCTKVGIGDLYDCSVSATCHESTNQTIAIEYGIGFVSGYPTYDRVALGEGEGLAVENQQFLQINNIRDIDQLKGEGILGIGKKVRSEAGYMTFIENLKKQGKIQRNMYSLSLLGNECRDDSKIVLGGYEESLYEGNITWVPGVDQESWSIAIELVFFNLADKHKSIDSVDKRALLDSGTSEIVMKSKDLEKIIEYFGSLEISCELETNHQQIPQLICDEGDEKKYPTFNVVIAGTIFSIKPLDYIASCFFRFLRYSCRLHFMADETLEAEALIILGQPFLNSYYSIYDAENNRIGLAKSVKEGLVSRVSLKTSFFQMLAILILTNALFFGLEYLCVNLKLCAKTENLNFVERLFKDFTIYPDVLVDEAFTARKAPFV